MSEPVSTASPQGKKPHRASTEDLGALHRRFYVEGRQGESFARFLERVGQAAPPPRPRQRGPLPDAGDTLGKCLLTQRLASGASCVVYRGLHTTLKIEVAVKVLTGDANDESMQLTQAEARILARLNHPSIVRVLDYDESGDWPWIVLEYCDGNTLKDLIRQSGAVEPGRAVRICRDLASALAAAHEFGIVHRDVKPSNVLLLRNGPAKLADLGMATSADERLRGIAVEDREGVVVGTPAYMAPEVVLGEGKPDFRADIYALGMTLYHAITGRPPFVHDDLQEVLRMQVEEPVRRPADFGPEHDDLWRILARMTSKNILQRPQTYPALLADLDEVIRGLPVGGDAASSQSSSRSTSRGSSLLASLRARLGGRDRA